MAKLVFAFVKAFTAPAARMKVILKKGDIFMRYSDEVMISFVRCNFKSSRIRNIIKAFRMFNLFGVCRGVIFDLDQVL